MFYIFNKYSNKEIKKEKKEENDINKTPKRKSIKRKSSKKKSSKIS